jgi:acyl-CoA reductase-like NAD-dependent aldehyde dehydrogenase
MPFTNGFRMLIGGMLEEGTAHIDVLNPATEQVVGRAPDATRDDLDRAVTSARSAFPGWASTPIEERRRVLKVMADALSANVDSLKRLLTSEQGKPNSDAETEILGAAYWLQAVSALDIPVTVHEDTAERYSETRRVPVGVVCAIVPWNFPVFIAVVKLAPALLAGNTVVLKPSPFTPLSTLRFGELVASLLPPGVLNIISGGDALGPWMTAHPDFDKISFTGSSATGKRVMQSASPTLKRITLELGGNDAAIVLPDVDVAAVAQQLFWAAFANNGQVCMATKRMYVHKDIYEPLRDALVAYARTVKVGDGAEQGTQIGPINNAAQYRRVLDLIKDAKDQGYTFLLGGESLDKPGYFVPITLIDNPPESSRIVQEEQFGPVLPLIKFDDVDEVIERVNASSYGLGGSVWSGDEDRAYAVAKRIETGTVWINEAIYIAPSLPFAGHKDSGIGVEGGVEGLLEYTITQNITRKRRA